MCPCGWVYVGAQAAPLYEDAFVRVEADAVVVKWYYFPLATSKRIPYAHVERIESGLRERLDLTETKTWGMALTPVWWPCDQGRWAREHYIILRLSTWPSCGLTLPTNDHARVLRILEKAWEAARGRSVPRDAGGEDQDPHSTTAAPTPTAQS
jgi:hypothetical protein